MKRAEMVTLLRSVGCGDGRCVLRPPGGMATNGGCHCFIASDDRHRLRALAMLVRELVLRLPEDPS